ncbi:MAG: ShlB/FhaC/HecB family hemolysin secretion/activation protein [Gammaproteobacteria bacterium]|nr:ShlB/FhaC/HecB family hemolysin secretion/activation protein [Gammaproteobacteria bacterium]
MNQARRRKKVGLLLWCAMVILIGVTVVHAATEIDSTSTIADSEKKTATEKSKATAPNFTVMEYQIEGNSVLPVMAIEQAVYPHLGEGKTIDDVEGARKSLEQTYQKAGYSTVFVDIPEQDVVNGVVRLRVIEGRVSRLSVTGSRYYSLGRIRAQVPALAAGSVPYLPAVQQQVNAVNNVSADRQITPVFRAGRTPGTVDVELKVKDQPPWHASLEVNNRYSGNTSRTRASGQLRYDNLWQRGHSLSLQYQTAPQKTDEVSVASVSYLLRADNDDDLTALYAVRSRSDVAAVGDISVIGSGDIYGLRRIIPLPPGKQYFHSLSLGIDLKDFRENVVLQGADSVETPIRYLSFSIAYNASLPGETASNQFSASLNFSLRGLADRKIDCLGQEVDQFECKRFNAHSNYFYLKGDYQRTQRLAQGMSWIAKIGGQLADQPLISNEQFSAGGADSVRGYLESERLGDNGLQASLEWRSPSLGGENTAGVQELLLLIFTDAAYLRVNHPLPEQQARFNLMSAGSGVRFTAWKNWQGELDWARAFKDGAVTKSGMDRLHFKLEYGF